MIKKWWAKSRTTAKRVIDFLMTALLMMLMAHHFIGQMMHEWIGVTMLILAIAHNVLNRNWYKNLFHGKYSAYRVLLTIIDILTIFATVGLIFSGIALSGHAFAFLRISGGAAFARELHHVSAYWMFVLASIHLGLHWDMITRKIRQTAHLDTRKRTTALRIAALLISVYGSYAFVKHEMPQYMLSLIDFSFFDYAQPKVWFFLEYFAIMGLFVNAGHVVSCVARTKKAKFGQRVTIHNGKGEENDEQNMHNGTGYSDGGCSFRLWTSIRRDD